MAYVNSEKIMKEGGGRVWHLAWRISRTPAAISHTTGHASRFPSSVTVSIASHQALKHLLNACKISLDFKSALQTYATIVKCGYHKNPSLLSTLISTLVCCGHLNLACQLQNETPIRDLDLMTANVIIARFMRGGDVDAAKRVFYNMHERDLVSWNSVIGGCIKNAHFEEALRFFKSMLYLNVQPDEYTFAPVVAGCARLGALDHAKWVHRLMIDKNITLNHILHAALIDMYAKCGRIEIARDIFHSIRSNYVSAWNAMINGLAIHGLSSEAISIFMQMEVENISPDAVTFMGILMSCSHCGLHEQGRIYFDIMRSRYMIEPQVEHYGVLVDLLGRSGHLQDAYSTIKTMPMAPDVVIWRSLLSACRIHKNSELGEIAIRNISCLNGSDYVLLSNTYCSLGKWNSAAKVRDLMRIEGIHQCYGRSWVELVGAIFQFKAGDKSHPETEAIYKVLEGLAKRTKLEGFVPTTELVLMDVSEEEKEDNLNHHSEKLALAFGILKTCCGTEIQISKNLRTCQDCHSWFKAVSRMLARVIVVRDRIRFHRFEGGSCSCGDYW
ncbi:hypothetical protein Nepgr_002939 [Nepenthes gracilis]|uniref:DYW domain-containing protein n=1 Tax=Nepenthes gracilis TaxID=150966 RepID=A0AAD3RYL7_NEPGR|nr:hypothetical protein Nepgr_002939 [Nepenthes gracilis]